MSATIDYLWNLTLPGRQVDPDDLASILSALAEEEQFDFRTRLLIRDSLAALQRRWGKRFTAWLSNSPHRARLEEALKSDLGPAGFPSLEKRLMEKTRPETVMEMLRELGLHVHVPTRLEIGGSVALILSGNLSRMTEDIDVVNEVPAELRSQHDLLNELASRYDLRVTHFQSHYLPSGWESRLRSIGRFGGLDVFLVDPCDIFVSKLFSSRAKDLDDLRALRQGLDKEIITFRVREYARLLLGEPELAENAAKNWYVVYGESLTEQLNRPRNENIREL